jgi:F0F1-type ATP synthase assembly protein I
MQEITSIAGLRNAILQLESEQEISKQLLKEQFYITYENLKPIALLKSAIKDISSSPYLVDNLSGTLMGLASGYLTKKMVVGSSGNLIRKLIGSVLQFGVTNVVAQHSNIITSVGKAVLQHFIPKNESNPDEDR